MGIPIGHVALLDAHANHLDETGRRLVVGNGDARQREVVTGAGPVTVEAPRVNDKRHGEKFSSYILPAYMRRSPKVTEVLPVLYLRGLSTGAGGDMSRAVREHPPQTVEQLAGPMGHRDHDVQDAPSGVEVTTNRPGRSPPLA